MKTELLKSFRAAAKADHGYRAVDMEGLIAAYKEDPDQIGKWAWDKTNHREELADICSDWPGWPECQCTGCGCSEPATCTDDSGIPVCAECQEYTTDDDGSVVCSRDERVEIVTESCGAGNQTRSYARLKPPEMPEEDQEGLYALYWETVCDDAHVCKRFATREDAEQAVAAKDWPRPGDNTQYLCGYSIRKLIDGEWQMVPEEELYYGR